MSQNHPPTQSPEWRERVVELFDTACRLPVDQRRDYLLQQCSVRELREEVERLLLADAAAEDAGFLPETVDLGKDAALHSTPAFPVHQQEEDEPLPDAIGKYQLIKLLGKGGFGRVYLADDPDLQIRVAIKVAHRSGAVSPELYLQEARTVARLDHPHIVPVLYVGKLEDGRCYLVCKYIEGSDLAEIIKEHRRPDCIESAKIVASIAEGLYHAHSKMIYHRDVKPSNILVDRQGKPYLTDFGIALTEADYGKEHQQAGTYRYMSPEQANGEGHLVDGRTDIFSLGVVLYELLTGQRPFAGDNSAQILDHIRKAEPRPPRERDVAIPRELERVCLKALEKQRTARYTTAWDMAEDLWSFVRHHPALPALPPSEKSPEPETAIVPRGLRSFEEEDQGFFLELLPGPRDMNGLPESIRSWKTKIETTDEEQTFRVGFLSGPSGCGKSSLVKAGLIPKLAEQVIPVYVEASESDTETRLLHRLRQACDPLPADLSLRDSLAALRHGVGMGRKVLLVLDQFEQWLHGRRDEGEAELVEALRQCDGRHVQCLISVRADFWMAVARLAERLDVELAARENFAAVDLFDEAHARKVLLAFGRAYGKLPPAPEPLSSSQESFVAEAVAELADQGKVICVHLALFAEMFRRRTWSRDTFKRLGGAEGVGLEFLNETFSDASSNPKHRLHKDAAARVLETLLPETGIEIRGPKKSEGQLFAASGCRSRDSFQVLLQILNDELRLITPTELTEAMPEATGDSKFYQLTHDYLVPSIQKWITQEKPMTRRGRAEARLKQLVPLWTKKPENRYLPRLWEYLNIQFLTDSDRWTDDQRNMMRRAGMVHGIRLTLASLVLLTAVLGGYVLNGSLRANALVRQVLTANTGELESVIDRLPAYRRWANEDLREVADNPDESRERRLNAGLALLPADSTQTNYLYQQLIDSNVEEFEVIVRALADYQSDIMPRLWDLLHNDSEQLKRRFRAGLALAQYASPDDRQWRKADWQLLADQLLDAYIDEQYALRNLLSGVSPHLIGPLNIRFRDEAVRTSAAAVLAQFAADDPKLLAQLACDATPGQYEVLLARLKSAESEAQDTVQQTLISECGQQPSPDMSEKDRLNLGRRRAGSAITLIHLNQPQEALQTFRVQDDPESVTQFVQRCGDLGLSGDHLLSCLELANEDGNLPARFALLDALGDLAPKDLNPVQQTDLQAKLKIWYANDPSSAIHSATGWLLRKWGLGQDMIRVDRTPLPWDPTTDREWFVENHGDLPMTFVVLPPGVFTMGSADAEDGRDKRCEALVEGTITRRFAMLDREISVREWKLFDEENRYPYDTKISPSDDHPVNSPDWYMAVEFCRWLTERAGLPDTQQCYADPSTIPENELVALKYERQLPKNWPFFPERTGYRLPTEAEWEYACRAGMRTAFSFGNDRSLLTKYAWCKENSGGESHPGRELRPNLRGLFDMYGNAWEWCHDWYAAELADELVDSSGPETGDWRVLRGGGWRTDAGGCRSADRSTGEPHLRNALVGFRIVRTLGDSPHSNRSSAGNWNPPRFSALSAV